jgi:hypothetical protein
MATQPDAPQGGTEGNDLFVQPSTVEPAPADTSEATTEQPTGAEEPAQADEASDTPKRKPWWEKRFDELTAKRYDAERESAYWRGIAEASKQQQQSQQPEPTRPPTMEECNWDESEFQRRSTQFYTAEARKAAREELQSQTAEQQQQSQLQTATQRLNEGAQKHADFMEAVSDIPITDAVRELLVNDPNAAEILYNAGKDPSEARRIFSLPTYLQAVELGKIAARLEAPKATAPRTLPPPPPQTVAGLSAGLQKQPQDMSMAEYVAYVKERDKA